MQSSDSLTTSVSSSDRRLLKRVKLTLWFVTLLLLAHGLPGALMKEMYPVTRWAMFSFPYNPLPQGPVAFLEVRVTDASGSVTVIPYYKLFDSVPVGSVQETLSARLLADAAGSPEILPEVRDQARQGLFDRLDVIFDEDVVQVEVWQLFYERDYERFPSVDLTKPIDSEQLAVLTPADVDEAMNHE